MSSLEDRVCRLRTAEGPQWENRAHTHTPNMIMLKYVITGGVRPVGNQAGTAPGPEPQLGPPQPTGMNAREKSRQGPQENQPTLKTDSAYLVFAQ